MVECFGVQVQEKGGYDKDPLKLVAEPSLLGGRRSPHDRGNKADGAEVRLGHSWAKLWPMQLQGAQGGELLT